MITAVLCRTVPTLLFPSFTKNKKNGDVNFFPLVAGASTITNSKDGEEISSGRR